MVYSLTSLSAGARERIHDIRLGSWRDISELAAPAHCAQVLGPLHPVNEVQELEFVLDGAVAGQKVSATEGVPFTRFIEFNADVQKYVQGGDSWTVLHDLKVQIQEGSYLLRVLIPAGLLPSLVADTAKLASGSTANIDGNRAQIVARWQQRAKSEPGLTFAIRSPNGAFAPVVITKDSKITREERIQWVDVERYIIGEITDWGGAQTVNVHVRPRNSKDTIIIDATAEQIREQRENLVFRKAIVHVRGKQNPKTGELKGHYRLVELRPYQPAVEEARLAQLFERGARAWADVPEGGAWVEELRGGAHG